MLTGRNDRFFPGFRIPSLQILISAHEADSFENITKSKRIQQQQQQQQQEQLQNQYTILH
jgi:hypothetical protein